MERLLPLILMLLSWVNPSKGCTHLYGIQPWQNPELGLCNPLNAIVQMGCSVGGVDNHMKIEWYRSTVMQLASQADGTPLQSGGRYSVESTMNVAQGFRNVGSMLSISDFQATDYGYYWCMVSSREGRRSILLPNPSKIIFISEPCNPTATQCESPLVLYNTTTQDCADDVEAIFSPPTSPECTQPAIATTTAMVPSPTYTIQPTTIDMQSTVEQASSIEQLLFHTPLEVPHTQSAKTTSLAMFTTFTFATQLEFNPSPTNVLLISEAQDKGSINEMVWLLIGVSIAILLAAIATALTAIVCIQCKRGRIKVRVTTSNTHLEISVGEESGSIARTSRHKQEHQDQRENPQDHDYSEIPILLEQLGSGTPVYQDTQEGNSTNHGYEDVLPNLTHSVRRHPYEKVIEGSSDYSKLQHQNSVKSQVSPQSSVKLHVSRQSSAATCTDQESAVQSNYLQRKWHHVDIYDSKLDLPSSDEDTDGDDQTLVPSSPESVYNTTLHCNGSLRKTSLGKRGREECSCVNTEALEATDYALLPDNGQIEMQQFESLYDSTSDVTKTQEVKLQGGNPTETKQRESDSSELTVVAKVKSDRKNDYYEHLDGLELPVVPQKDGDLVKPATLSVCEDAHTKQRSNTPSEGTTSYNHLTPTTDSRAHALPTFNILHDPDSSAADGDYSHLDLTLHTEHEYTSLDSSQLNTQSVYNVPIVTAPDVYISEHGHHYHVLEAYMDN